MDPTRKEVLRTRLFALSMAMFAISAVALAFAALPGARASSTSDATNETVALLNGILPSILNLFVVVMIFSLVIGVITGLMGNLAHKFEYGERRA